MAQKNISNFKFPLSLVLLVSIKLLLTTTILAQHRFDLKGFGFDIFSGRKVTMYYREDLSHGSRMDTVITIIKNGCFSLYGFIENPAATATIIIEEESKTFGFVLDSGLTEIRLNRNLFPRDIYPIMSATNVMYRKVKKMYASNMTHEGPLHNQTHRDVLLKALEMVKQNPHNFYSAIVLANVSIWPTSILLEDLHDAWEGLGAGIKSTETGKYIERKIKNKDKASIGQPLPKFELLDENGGLFTNSLMKPKPYIIVFGASWCSPCKKLIPVIKAKHSKYAEKGLEILYINLENDKAKWQKMINDFSIQRFTNVYDSSKPNFSAISFAFEIKGIPIVLVVDDKQIIHYNSIKQGDYDIKTIDSYIDRMLN